MKRYVPFIAGCGIVASWFLAPPAKAASFSKDLVLNVAMECLNDALILKTNPAIPRNQWYYTHDALDDGSGGPVYDIHGMAIRETAQDLLIVLNGNMPLAGNSISDFPVQNGTITWGDLFLNLSGNDFLTAMNQGQLYGIRFAESNDSSVEKLGLYQGVVAKSVALQNMGYGSLLDYYWYFQNSTSGDLPTINSYYDPSLNLNEIASGKLIAPLEFLTHQDLQNAGYDFQQFGGSETIAFRLPKSSIPDWPHQSVPEGSNLIGLALMAGLGGWSGLRRYGRQDKR